MLCKEKIAVVVPCLNEANSIAVVVRNIRKFLPFVIVVDDGSQDETANLASGAGAQIIRHERSLGKGAALQAGWKHALELGFEMVLTMDGDGQHSPNDIPRFLAGNTSALTVGNRMVNVQRIPFVRRQVNRWMSRRLSAIAGQDLPDTQCGYRLMNLKAWAEVQLATAHFETESELLLAFIAAGHSIEFVPIEVIYKNEQSKIHPIVDTLRWFRWYFKARQKFGVASAKIGIKPVCEPAT